MIAANPDFVFLADTICCQQDAATVAARPGWAGINAVKNGGVVELERRHRLALGSAHRQLPGHRRPARRAGEVRRVPASAWQRALAGAGALAIDAAIGEPPARLHPVVGMGSMLAALRARSRAAAPAAQVAEGAAALLAVAGAATLGAAVIQRALRRLPGGAVIAGEAAALSTLLALRGLREAVDGVREALEVGDLPAARAAAARDLVSRDTADLDACELSERRSSRSPRTSATR